MSSPSWRLLAIRLREEIAPTPQLQSILSFRPTVKRFCWTAREYRNCDRASEFVNLWFWGELKHKVCLLVAHWPIGSLAHWPLANAMVLQYSAIVVRREGRRKVGSVSLYRDSGQWQRKGVWSITRVGEYRSLCSVVCTLGLKASTLPIVICRRNIDRE